MKHIEERLLFNKITKQIKINSRKIIYDVNLEYQKDSNETKNKRE
jgi:hypothetical protein